MKQGIVVILLLLISGCAVVPESIQVEESVELISYQQAAMAPDQQQGKVARWGGVIAAVENKNEQTMFEIVSYPLVSYGKPTSRGDSYGRFRVYVDGFLDPVIYEMGRTITFTGTLSGIEEGLVGEHVYHYPTIQATGYYLWKDVQHVDVNVGLWGPYWHPGWGYYGWHAWPYHHRGHYHRSRVKYYDRNQSSGQPSTPSNRPTTRSDRNEVSQRGLKKQH